MSSLDLSFNIPSDGNKNRGAYRASFKGIFARVDENKKIFEVVDISASGCSLKIVSASFKVGIKLNIDIIIANKVIVGSLQTEVVRLLSDSVVACSFLELSRKQEYDLDKLILEIQKREISNMKL